jgi:hypothetical protein
MPFKKGKPKTGGRTKGTINRTTKEAREVLDKILFAEIDNIEGALKAVKKKSDIDYLETLSKLLTYSLPKKSDITTGGEKINITFTRNGTNDKDI